MKLFTILLLALTFNTYTYSMPEDVKAHFSVNGSNTKMVMPGVPATIEIFFTDPRSEKEYVYKDFKEMHGKLMHMVIIKDDLSVFKHVHPYFDPITGRFMITLNMPLSDPDNFHTNNALVSPGMYMVMADVEIHGVGMRMAHLMLMVKGEQTKTPLILSDILNNTTQKEFSANGTDYKITMEHKIIYGCGSKLVNFEVRLFEKNSDGVYELAKDLENWLTQGAHSVWVSEKLMHKHGMHYAHMHSDLPESPEDPLIFSFHDTQIMKPGIQKVWFQIKHKGEVLTIPLIFNYLPNDSEQSCE